MAGRNPALRDPLTPWWRAAVLLRVVTYAFAISITGYYDDQYARPALGWTAAAVLGGWTVLTCLLYLRDGGPPSWLVELDLVVGCAIMISSRWVLTAAQLGEPDPIPLLTTVWVTSVLAAGAIRLGPVGGVVFGVVLAAFNFGAHGYVDLDLVRDAVEMIAVGFAIGLATQTARRSAVRLATALRAEAATAERERLARSIHDGVLQVLARVQRRGTELGGEAAELAELAGEQEVALRALVSAASPESTPEGEVDLRAQLQLLTTPKVNVSVPGTQVMLPTHTATELTSVVREALANVAEHAGPTARAWVLLEDLGPTVVLSVRDDGAGIPAGRLRGAEAEGRMGVARSIRGRVAELGGRLDLTTAPGEGTEWEMTVPRGGRNQGER
jgi:signal transduction histidine kinase